MAGIIGRMGEDPIVGNKYYKPNAKRAAEKAESAKIRGQRENSFNGIRKLPRTNNTRASFEDQTFVAEKYYWK